MPPCMRRVWRAAHRSTNSSPNEYPSTGAAIVPMTCSAILRECFQDNGDSSSPTRKCQDSGVEWLGRFPRTGQYEGSATW